MWEIYGLQQPATNLSHIRTYRHRFIDEDGKRKFLLSSSLRLWTGEKSVVFSERGEGEN